MFYGDIPLLAIVLATIAYMIIGFIWYNRDVFGEKWASSLIINKDEIKTTPKDIVLEVVLGLVTAYVLALFIDLTQIYTFGQGVAIGFWSAIGFVATTLYSQVIWSKRPLRATLIEIGFHLVAFIVMGGIIGALF